MAGVGTSPQPVSWFVDATSLGATKRGPQPARLSDVFENKVGAIMVDRADSREIAKRAKELYETRWRAELERDPLPEFAAMEPESARYFVGKSFRDAIRSARLAHPDRVTFTLRIGHDCAIGLIGMLIERQSLPGDEWPSRSRLNQENERWSIS